MKKYLIISAIGVVLLISLVSAAWFTGKAVWSWNWCSSSNKCPAGEGDCDTNNDCKTGYCAMDVGQKYRQSKWMDVCECKSGETFYQGKCLTNDCYTLISNINELLNSNSEGIKCGDSNYKAIYDVDKDRYIVPKDSLIATNNINSNPSWCSQALKDTTDVCNNSGEGSGGDYYTKAEIDETFNIFAGALENSGTCETTGKNKIGSTQINNQVVGSVNMDTCNEICGTATKRCLIGFLGEEKSTGNILLGTVDCGGSRASFAGMNNYNVECICCRALGIR